MMGIWEKEFVSTWRKDHIKVEVNNSPSVFMQSIFNPDPEAQKARKKYHLQVINEYDTMLQLRGVKTISSGGNYSGLN